MKLHNLNLIYLKQCWKENHVTIQDNKNRMSARLARKLRVHSERITRLTPRMKRITRLLSSTVIETIKKRGYHRSRWRAPRRRTQATFSVTCRCSTTMTIQNQRQQLVLESQLLSFRTPQCWLDRPFWHRVHKRSRQALPALTNKCGGCPPREK